MPTFSSSAHVYYILSEIKDNVYLMLISKDENDQENIVNAKSTYVSMFDQ